ncbi:hypothetical protein [Paenibacillus sp. MMO-177]|uniref:hypothetical protein n=1 Tax=Paenibacillus sp. MMO-177 TaxID=3081289 RepID=UPI00301985C5
MKSMNKRLIKFLGNERGGIAIMLMSLILLICCILFLVIVLDYLNLSKTQNKLKNDLNRAVHAASLSIDEIQLSKGYFKLDTSTPGLSAQDMFYHYLQANMGLNATNKAIEGSILQEGSAVVINELVYADWESNTIVNLNVNPTSCTISTTYHVSCSVTLNAGTDKEIQRTIDQTIVGPSVVAIISTSHKGIGRLIDDEPLLIPAVQEVYFLKR